ncbi:MAG: RNA 3'-terminal phosphate cyclase [Halodesulfurarchaeum sp.]
MKRIDGEGGGGQVLRLAVSFAALENTSITVENVRGGRENPGLRAQHVAAIESITALTDGESDGVRVGSETVTFEPGDSIGGETAVDVGTAGSIPLVFDAVLPLAMAAESPILLHATGGTDVKWAPPIDFLRTVKFPVLERFGLEATIEQVSRGFYPQGGGSATLKLVPVSINSIDCVDRGGLEAISIHSVATDDLSSAEVTTRQIDGVKRTLNGDVSVPISDHRDVVESPSTGTVVLVVAQYERSRAGFSALGEPGWPAEEVGAAAASAFLTFHDTRAAVERHLADQLLPFLARSGGTITTPKRTAHIRSSISLLSAFDHPLDVHRSSRGIRIESTQST